MSTILDEVDRSLAETLKRLRESRGLSLTDLAAKSGVSRAMIHKVESGASSPTAALLGRLSGAFGLTVSQLLIEVEGGQSRVARAENNPVWVDPETGFRRRVLSPVSFAGHLELIAMRCGNPVQVVISHRVVTGVVIAAYDHRIGRQ